VEKWKTVGGQWFEPVENNVEMWITLCKYLLWVTLCLQFRHRSKKILPLKSLAFLMKIRRKEKENDGGTRRNSKGEGAWFASFPPWVTEEYKAYMERLLLQTGIDGEGTL